jgi:hypothetical protein
VNLKEWAKREGVHPVTAYRWFREGRLPVPARRVGGLIVVEQLVVADRWFPSSKTCSGCGVAKAKLPLRVRTFVCDACGLALDRDLNAARNLARLVERESGTAVGGDPQPQGSNGRGADRKTPPVGPVAVKRSPHPGTVGRKRPATDRQLTKAH